MAVQPDKKLQQIIFAEQRAPIWASKATTLGLTPAQTAAITDATASARGRYDEALAIREAAKAATVQGDNALRDLRTLVAEAIKAIRLKAEATNDPDLYAVAQIPPPALPTPAQPPTKPTNVTFTIEPTGALTLSWTNNPATPGLDSSTVGVIYTIRRRINAEANFTIVGAVPAARAGRRGLTSFTDDTLLRAATNIQYLIVPQRGTLTGPMSEVFSIRLGVGPGGLAVVESTSSQGNAGVRLAA